MVETGIISISCTWCDGGIQKMIHYRLEFHKTRSGGGTTHANSFACGANWRNFAICNRDKASAIKLFFPGTCLDNTVKLCEAEHKVSLLTKGMI